MSSSSSSSFSSSSTLVPSNGSQVGQKEILPEEPYVSLYGDWTSSEIKLIFRDVKPDPMPSLVMLQMVADAYEERRRVWDFNEDRPRRNGDNPAMYEPINEAQKKVEDFLVEWRFLSGPSVLDKEALITDKLNIQRAVAPAEKLTILPSSENRGHRIKKSSKHSTSMKIRYVLHNLNIVKIPQARSIPKRPRRRAVPAIPARRLRPVLPALPRIDPGYEVKPLKQMTLRRMTRADSCILRACSVRRRKFTPAPEYKPTAEFLAELHPPPRRFIPTHEPRIQHDDLKTLFSMQPQDRRRDLDSSMSPIGKTKVTSVNHKKFHASLFISLTIYLLIQLIILALSIVGVFVALWTLSCAILKCFQKCLLFVLDLPQLPEEDIDF